jgi:hypothetical protein
MIVNLLPAIYGAVGLFTGTCGAIIGAIVAHVLSLVHRLIFSLASRR